MEMVDLMKSFVRAFADRAKSRFFFAFSISWLLANWKFLYVVARIPYEKDYSPMSTIDLHSPTYESSLVVPTVGALAITILVPYIDAGISWARHFAELWSKTSNEYTRSRIEVMKAKHLKSQLSAITTSESAAKTIESKEKGGTSRDKKIYVKLDSVMNEVSLRKARDEFATQKFLTGNTLTNLNNFLISVSSVSNSFENQELRTLQLATTKSLSILVNKIRSELIYDNAASVYEIPARPSKMNGPETIIKQFDEFILDYEALRKLILDIFGE